MICMTSRCSWLVAVLQLQNRNFHVTARMSSSAACPVTAVGFHNLLCNCVKTAAELTGVAVGLLAGKGGPYRRGLGS